MKKVLFGITGLTLGGAERVLVDIANQLAKNFEVTIFTLYAGGELEKELVPTIKRKSWYSCSYESLSKEEKRKASFRLFFHRKQIYKKCVKENYDVEIAFLEGPITRLFSSKNRKVKKIAWIHNDIALVFGKGWKARIKKWLDRKNYAKYQMLVFVSKDNQKSFERTYPDLRDDNLMRIKQRVIYNYIDGKKVLEKAEKKIEDSLQEPNFLEVARLTEQKAIDRLIKVHAKLVNEKTVYHHIYVIGDGPEKEKLQQLIKDKKVEETFHLLGKRENPYPYMQKADCIALLSQFEGYPMVLEEAKILGKPILITNMAAREVVQTYSNSKIVDNNEEGIEKGIREMLQQRQKRKVEESKLYDNSKIIEKIRKIIEE